MRVSIPAIVGLHNPEPAYSGTRHNVGAEVIAALTKRSHARLRRGPRRVRCRVAQVRIGADPALLAVPTVSMNVSGPPVRALIDYYKVVPEDLLVIHDDIDLPFGRLRLRSGHGHGGHNGVRSIVGSLGTADFWRLKLGLGRPPGRMDPADYVLSRFSAAQREDVDHLVADAADVVERFMTDPERAMELAGGRRP
ncbi:MAG: aminoacyl-tRNA hydrolase [Acidimicrobiia bacterium]|nr:aminoacyl-tRNA hydrolase [Acidimicrobiia bacterium]